MLGVLTIAALLIIAIGFVLGIIFIGAGGIAALLWIGIELAICIIPVILGITLFYLIFLY